MRWAIAALISVGLWTLTGCGPQPQPRDLHKVEESMKRVGGNTDTMIRQEVISPDVRTGQLRARVLFPKPDGGFHLVDETGAVFDSYDDFFRHNTWPRDPER